MPAPVHVSDHPLVRHQLARLRAAATPPPAFRRLVAGISRGLLYEAARDLAVWPVEVTTPLARTTCHELGERVGLVPVLRAGLGMAEAMAEALPEAAVWHLGLFRDHTTLRPVTYYNKLPDRLDLDRALVLDPMLATAGTAVAAIDLLKRHGVPKVVFVGIIAAPEGVRAVQDAHPDVPLYLAALDSHLNDVGYIVPGLGDAGDRQFGTA